ncbi:asparaginase [Siphonobacter curvatus]|uniref:asparaginase n=1 Tax=Siphonobacter curvatus TaxID=2094562 RepID=UPI0037426248
MTSLKIIKLDTAASASSPLSVLVIYTGGTFGMVYDRRLETLVPFNFEQILERIPELARLRFSISVLVLDELLDSSNMVPNNWLEISRIIGEHYEQYDSFVIVHGTDTMAYTASALSFLFENLNKPVILTGAQLPIGAARTDAVENFITALEIAAARDEQQRPMVPEVAIYFHSYLLRGNRARKQESSQFNAFQSENYPYLAEAGVTIDYNRPYIRAYDSTKPFSVHETLDANVVILKLFPGISPSVMNSIFSIEGLKGVVLETYGAGNAPTAPWFLETLEKATDRGLILLNVSQCTGGRVLQGRYQTSKYLNEMGLVSGADLTSEAAVTKLMFLLGQYGNDSAMIRQKLTESLRGELS